LWKQQTAYLHKNYLEKKAAEEREAAERRTRECQQLNKFIADQMYMFGKAARQRANDAEQAEEDRLAARAAAKEKRRQARFAAEEKRQRELMCTEDRRSFRMRYFEYERHAREREMHEMALEEEKQTRIDRFWGIPTAIRNAKNLQMQGERDWRGAVDELRALCMQVKVLRPYPSEYGHYRDKFTGKKIPL
jgi:hypothetical protein